MVRKYFKDEAPSVGSVGEEDKALKSDALALIDTYNKLMPELGFHKTLMAVWELVGKVNKYIDSMAPWVLAKSDRERLGTVMVYLLESLKIVSVLVWPFMPETSEKIQGFLGLHKKGRDLKLEDLPEWGKEKTVMTISKIPHLFPRIEENRDEKDAKPEKEIKKKDNEDRISFQEFQRLDLRVGSVLRAERIHGSKNLLKVIVNIGEERTVVAGLVGHYTEEDLAGKQVVVVANLEPAKLMGVESQGMILAAEDESGVHLLLSDVPVTPGTKIK
jgi:methionyl-tRNA synthetase